MIKNQAARLILLPLLALFLLKARCSETVNIQLRSKVGAYLVTDTKTKILLVETDPAHLELNNWLEKTQQAGTIQQGGFQEVFI
jgi:hypothetical protein